MRGVAIGASTFLGKSKDPLPGSVLRGVRKATLVAAGSRSFIDNNWSRKDQPCSAVGLADLVYVGTELAAKREWIGLRTPTSIPGRARTFLDLGLFLDSLRSGTVVMFDLAFEDANAKSQFQRILKGYDVTALWSDYDFARFHGGVTLLSWVWELLLRGGRSGPELSTDGLSRAVGLLAVELGEAFELNVGKSHHQQQRFPGSSVGPWGEDPRNLMGSRGSREDAIQMLARESGGKIALRRDQARSSLLRVAGADCADNVRSSAVRALSRLMLEGDSDIDVSTIRVDRGTIDAMQLVPVPAGRYRIGSITVESLGLAEERPAHFCDLGAFRLMRFPVTNGLLRRIGVRWEGEEHLPATNISWFDAIEIARAMTKSALECGAISNEMRIALPSEVEWEAAAAGACEREFPWGESFETGRCNSKANGADVPIPVGSFSPIGDGPYGHSDLAGNVWEWTRSAWGASTHHPDFAYPYVRTDGREVEGGDIRRVVRGGAYYYDDECVRTRTRNHFHPSTRHSGGGFRLALAPVHQ